MPFYPYREESDQADLLVPRPGWECGTSAAALVVYRDKTIVKRTDFDHERRQIVDQAPTLRAYADNLMANALNVAAAIAQAANTPRDGQVILGFSASVSRLPQIEMATFARKQIPVLTALAELTAGQAEVAEFHQYYRDNAAGMRRYLERQ